MAPEWGWVGDDNDKPTSAVFDGSVSLTSAGHLFDTNNPNQLETIDLNGLDLSGATDAGHMFSNCRSLKSIDFTPVQTSQITNMDHMFYDCGDGLTIKGLDTSSCTNMCNMFGGFDGSIPTNDENNFDMSNVVVAGEMFMSWDTTGRPDGIDLDKIDTSKLESLGGFFGGCDPKSKVDLSKLRTDSAKSMKTMFAYGSAATGKFDLTQLDTTGIEDFSYMFEWSLKLKSIDVSSDYFAA